MSFNKIIFQREPDVAEPAAAVKYYGYRSSADEIPEELPEIPETPALPVEEPPVTPPVEVPPIPVVPEPTPPTPEKPADVTATDWKAALKTADKYEALKELGYDDFTIGMLKYKEQAGDFTPYLQVKTVDYSKMDAQQILKISMEKENPGMSEKALNFKYNKELSEKYYLDREQYPEDSDEAIYGQEQMRLDAEKKREQFITEQAQFKAPEPKPDTSAAERELEQTQHAEKQKGLLLNNPVTQALQASKSISFGEGEESFNFPIDADSVVSTALSALLDSGKEFSPEGLLDFYQTLAISANKKAFFAAYDTHRESIAKKKLEAELGNITPKGSGESAPPVEEKDYSYKTK